MSDWEMIDDASTSNQVVDVEKFVQNVVSKSGLKTNLADNGKYVLYE